MTNSNTFQCKKKDPCNRCPFLVTSAPGWLGPWKASSLQSYVMGSFPFPCHMTQNGKGTAVQLCAGSMLYRFKQGKLARTDEPVHLYQEAFKELTSNFTQIIDLDQILNTPAFLEHHQRAEELGTI